jgi:hypothetical protein
VVSSYSALTLAYVSLFQVAMSGKEKSRDAGIGNHAELFDFFFTGFQRRREKL